MVSDSCLVTKSCLTLCDPMDSSPPGSFVLWILQARILDWVAISFSRKKKKTNILWVIFGKQVWSTSFNFYVLNLIQGGRHAAADGACTVRVGQHLDQPLSQLLLELLLQLTHLWANSCAALWLNTASLCFPWGGRYFKEDMILVYSCSLHILHVLVHTQLAFQTVCHVVTSGSAIDAESGCTERLP